MSINKAADFSMQDVLFQKLANQWFAITEKDGEVLFSTLPKGLDPKTDLIAIYKVLEEREIMKPFEINPKLEQAI